MHANRGHKELSRDTNMGPSIYEGTVLSNAPLSTLHDKRSRFFQSLEILKFQKGIFTI